MVGRCREGARFGESEKVYNVQSLLSLLQRNESPEIKNASKVGINSWPKARGYILHRSLLLM